MIDKAFKLPLGASACGGVDQLVDKPPFLKETTPELIRNAKETLTTYFKSASFSLAQVAFVIVDTGLEVVEQVITMAGGPEENTITNGSKTIHTTANTIRIEGNNNAKKIEEVSIVGALVRCLTCLTS